MQLPPISNEEQLSELMTDPDQVGRCLEHVSSCLRTGPLSTPVRGSALVGLSATSVVKLMAPMDREFAAVERVCLESLDGALPVATPAVLDHGTLDGWSYLLMERLPGIELKELWPSLDQHQRVSIATQLGECLGVLHQLSAPREVPRCDWPSWSAERVAGIQQRQSAAPAAWVDALPGLLGSADLSAGEQGWLHTEVMLEHLLVERDGEHVRLSGLFDFEPSWVGPVHYEFAAVAIFVSSGDKAVLAEVMRAAGQQIGPDRLFSMALVHRYSNLAEYRRRLGGPDELPAWIDRFFGH